MPRRPPASSRFCLALGLLALFAAAAAAQQLDSPQPGDGWPTYGGDPGGSRFSTSAQITRANLSHLHPVWTFHTHALDGPDRLGLPEASFEATPVLFGRSLIFTSPFDVVFAVDATTGRQLWSHDPHAAPSRDGMLVTSRGVALWTPPPPRGVPAPPDACAARVFLGTLDARLLALDAATGTPCPGFGVSGQVDLTQGIDFQGIGGYSVTSPPTVLGNVVIVGSSVGDNQQVASESGLVRAFDTVTGRLLWSWEPLPWASSTHPRTGAGNVWSVISADPALGLLYLPTSSASPDYYGGLRPGDNRDADSVVALDAATGRRVWAFQVVHHNVWDYDVPSEPLLFTFRPNTSQATPALAITTKMGQVFVLDRRTGRPLYPVAERPVPQSDVPGEATSPTQPFSSLPPLSPLTPPPGDRTGWQRSPENAAFCRQQLSRLRYDGIYTPPSLHGSLLFPGNVGGVNWGGAAFDPTTGTLYAAVNREAFAMTLIPRNGVYMHLQDTVYALLDFPIWLYLAGGILALSLVGRYEHNRLARRPGSTRIPIARPWLPSLRATVSAMLVASMAAVVCFWPHTAQVAHFGHELSPQRGSPYLILRDPLLDHDGHPCVAPPWGALTALNLNTGTLDWQTPVGSMIEGQNTGTTLYGGPIVTAAGLLFTAGSADPYLRAYDAPTGRELWRAELPAAARSTPMTYTLDGRQFVVIAAGGHGGLAGQRGDSLVAFALDRH